MFFVVIASLFAVSLIAQDAAKTKKTPESMAAKQTETMIKELNLSAEQGAKISQINLNYAGKMATARQQKEKEEYKKLIQARDVETKAVLTPEQYTQWKEYQKAKMEEKRKKEEGGNAESGKAEQSE